MAMVISYADSDLIQLKKYLLTLPQTFNFKYIPEVKKSITETLNSVIKFSPNDLVIDESNHNHYGRACGKKFLRGETCYRCLTCGYDETCALCSYCFQKERHLNHQIHKSLIQRENAGCCDCGDEEAYKNAKCEYFIKPSTSIIDTDLSNELIMHLTEVLAILIDYIIDVMNHSIACFKAPDTAESVENYSRVSNLDPSIYGETDIESNSFALVLYSDQVHQYKDAVQRIRFLTGKVTEFAEMVASRCNIHGRAIVMISDNISFLLKKQEMLTSTGLTACIKSTRDIFREEMCDEIISWLLDFTQSNISKNVSSVRCTIAKVLLRPYRKGCLNNPVNVIKENVMLAPKSLRYTPFQKESIPDLLSRKWDIPEEIKNECEYPDILLESQNSQDIQFIGSRLQFLLFFDVRFCKTPRIKLHNIYVPTIVNNLKFKQMMVAQFLDIYEEVLSLFLLIDREPEFSIMPILSTQVFTCPSNDSLILKHGDVFKMIRAIYNYVTTCQTVNTINSSFPGNKTGIVFSTLKNRKWAHVLLDLTYIVTRNPYVDNIIFFFYCFPEYVHFLAVFQSKPVFQREAKKHIEYENQDYTVFFNAVSVISHFSENIGKVLNRVPKEKLLSQGNSMDCWYHSYSNTMKKSFTETLYTIIVRKIIEVTFTENDTYFNDMNKTNSKFVEDQEDAVVLVPCDEYPEYNMVKFNVLEDKMSFLHPLHSMFSWLVEMDQSMDSEKRLYNIMDIIQGEYEFHCSELISAASGSIHDNSGRYDGIMGFFDIPVRKIVLVSQIKVGLWVRNGVSIRSQMNLYRYSGSREFGYMRDLFLCQLYLGYLPVPQLALYNVFDRWRLIKWGEGEFNSNDYNPAQLQAMVEEFVLFIIHLVTEDLHLHKKSATELSDLLIQREIVHALCFRPLPFSKITAEIPDHICTEKRFSVVFSQCVEEVEKSNRNKGERKIYKLKESLMDTVDPYYVHYNSNKRDECIAIMKERIHQITNIKKSEVIIPLKNINWRDSPFERITNIVLDERLINFLLFTLLYCKDEILKESSFAVKQNIGSSAESQSYKELDEKGNCESLLELTIHLIHITVTHKNASEISSIFLSRFFSNLLDMLKLPGFSGFSPKIKAILKIIYEILKTSNHNFAAHFPEFSDEIFDVSFDSKNTTMKNKWENDPAYEKKKKMAKRKRNKLLAKLKKQQQKFAENFCIDEDINTNTLSSGKTSIGNMIDPIEGMEDVNLEDCCQADDANTWSYPEHTCILCHLPPANDDEPFGVFSYVTESNEFRYVPCKNDYWFFKAFNGNVNLDEWESSEPKNDLDLKLRETEKQCVIGPGFSNTDSEQGGCGYNDNLAVVTSCCHGMHYSCFKQYFDSSRMKQMAQITRTVPENTQRREFFCPLCKTINNVFVPIYFTKNSQNFFQKFSESIPIMDLIYPKMDERVIRDQFSLNTLSDNLLYDVKSKVSNKDWFIKTEVVDNVTKHIVDETSITRNVLMECMDSLSLLTPPFDSINNLISKTIESIEISLRGEGYGDNHKTRLIIFQINNQTLTGLRIWIQLKELFQCLYGVEQSGGFPENLVGMYQNLINEDELVYDGQDFFEILVSLEEATCLGINFQKLVGISYVQHVKQSLLKILSILMHKVTDENFKEMRDFDSLITEEYKGDKLKMRVIIGAFTGLESEESNEINLVYSMLLKLVTPFLRKCLIFAYAKFASFPIEEVKVELGLNECDRICQVMKMPTTEEIINGFDVDTFKNISIERKNQLYASRIAYPGVIRLISLPQKLNDFYTEYYNKKKEDERPKDPAICLYCSKMVDLQTANYGDEFGSCNMHIRWECIDAGKGIFLLPRNNCILLLDNGKGSFIESPYMDDYGEGDEDAKKGHDMHLSESKYKELQMNIWLQHNIQNFIARKLENLSDVGGWLTL